MAVPHVHVAGTKAKASEVNANNSYFEGLIGDNEGTNGTSTAPIGSVLPWLKTYTNTPSLPDGWMECDGSTVSDADSPYNGQTLPNLNGSNYFLRGASTSGGTGGSNNFTFFTNNDATTTGSGTYVNSINGITSGGSHSVSLLPPYYEVVFIIKIK